MTSTRFPGKVLRPIAGRPLLWHIVQRLRRSRHLDAIILATTANAADDPLAAFAESEGLLLVRGSEDNVLSRFQTALERWQPDYLVGICGDSPMIDPGFVDYLMETLIAADGDYLRQADSHPCVHEGIDPVSSRALAKLCREAGDHPVAREHVNGYFRLEPDFARAVPFQTRPEDRFKVRLSVDTPADLAFFEALYAASGAAPGALDFATLRQLLEDCPELRAINAHVRQKTLHDGARTVLIRCDGGARIGWGHVVRCRAIAEELREQHSLAPRFAIRGDDAVEETLRAAGFAVDRQPADQDEGAWLASLIERHRPIAALLDVRTALTLEDLRAARGSLPFLALLDDASPRRLAADLALYPPAPRAQDLDWTDFAGEVRMGWEWVPLHPDFRTPPNRRSGARTRLLVTMGGSDPRGYTVPVLEALERFSPPLALDVVIGPSNSARAQLEALAARSHHSVTLHHRPASLRPLMETARLALATFGVTAYELARMGVPSLLFCLDDDHRSHAAVFVEAGLGEIIDQTDGLEANVARQLNRPACELPVLVDGCGAQRIARMLAQQPAASPVR
jgi:spore coat polysaccharide biosynthesis protein SpsF